MFREAYTRFCSLDDQPTTLIPISQPEIIYASNPRYPDTPFSGRILALCDAEIVDIPQVCVPFATDVGEQMLEEKMGFKQGWS